MIILWNGTNEEKWPVKSFICYPLKVCGAWGPGANIVFQVLILKLSYCSCLKPCILYTGSKILKFLHSQYYCDIFIHQYCLYYKIFNNPTLNCTRYNIVYSFFAIYKKSMICISKWIYLKRQVAITVSLLSKAENLKHCVFTLLQIKSKFHIFIYIYIYIYLYVYIRW